MLINSGDFIKHEKFLDICIEVQHVVECDTGYKILGNFWNQAYVNSFPIDERVIVDIAYSKTSKSAARTTSLDEWKILKKEDAGPCLRKSDWKSL